MDSEVVHKCTVFGSDGEELFQLEGNERVALALAIGKSVAEKWRPDEVEELKWQFEKIYPESAAAQFQPPDMDDRLEEFANGVAAIVNASNQV